MSLECKSCHKYSMAGICCVITHSPCWGRTAPLWVQHTTGHWTHKSTLGHCRLSSTEMQGSGYEVLHQSVWLAVICYHAPLFHVLLGDAGWSQGIGLILRKDRRVIQCKSQSVLFWSDCIGLSVQCFWSPLFFFFFFCLYSLSDAHRACYDSMERGAIQVYIILIYRRTQYQQWPRWSIFMKQ